MKNRINGRALARIVFFLLMVECLSQPATANENYCDPYLTPREDHPYAYRDRGDRCEGIYIKKVSSNALLLVSLTQSFEAFEAGDTGQLPLQWKTIEADEIRLRAYGVKPRLYYRMDTVRPGMPNAYLWPTEVLSALGIKMQHIGLLAWVEHSIANVRQKVYVPLQIGRVKEASEPSDYGLTLLPGRELTEIFLSLATIDTHGNPKKFLEDERPLQYGYYPPGRLVHIPLKAFETPGIYFVQIGATLSGGGVTTISFLLYHQVSNQR